jgi:endonuclease/exonuclease/phosphatase family metal-dependent hydrolase
VQAANRETALLVAPGVEVQAVGDLRLPHPPGRIPRAAAWAEVAVVGERVTVVSAHLGLDPAERLEQADVVRQAATQWPDAPLVIAGDLNEQPTEPAGRVLAEGLKDAGAVEDAPTFPARSPTRRIDAVLVDPRLRVVACRTLTGYERATDHCPVIVDLEPA